MIMKKCKSCAEYTLKDICPKCKKETSSAHYKFIKLKDVKEENATS